MKRPTVGRILGPLAAVLVVGLLASACGTSRADTHRTDAATSSDDHASIMAIIRCFRSHGSADFPDPVYDPGDGRWHFAISPASVPPSIRQACQSLFPVTTPSPDLPQAQFQQLVRFAQCMRSHGVATWPDPSPDGYFHLPADLWQGGKRGAIGQAMRACNAPSTGINLVPQG
jgi:hypothetical protein